jgi:hypothetical protein
VYDFQAGQSPNSPVTPYQRNVTPPGASWQHVVLEKDPATMVAPDVANVGPAPRQLTPALKAYLRNNAPRWDLLFAIIAVPAPLIFIIGVASVHMSVGTIVTNLFYTLAFCAFGWWARTRNAAIRAALEATLTDGQLRFARLIENRQHVYRKGGHSYYRYDAVFQIDGRNVPFRSYNTGMAMVDRGQLIEVIYNPAYPDMILPTFLLV